MDESFRANTKKTRFLRTEHIILRPPINHQQTRGSHHRVSCYITLPPAIKQRTPLLSSKIQSNINIMYTTSLICASLIGSAAAFAPASQTSTVSTALNAEPKMSKALPFAACPKILDGSMAGDVGFE